VVIQNPKGFKNLWGLFSELIDGWAEIPAALEHNEGVCPEGLTRRVLFEQNDIPENVMLKAKPEASRLDFA
jgi:hypothetical protein